jgi:hypothetical protein
MNTLEERFATEFLEPMRLGGEIQWWAYEPMRFRIGGSAFYKPDFVVVDGNGQVVAYETKGVWREAAKVRIRVAADRFPWVHFIAVQVSPRGGFDYESFGPREVGGRNIRPPSG